MSLSRRPAQPFDGLGAFKAKPAKKPSEYRRYPLALRRELLLCIQRLERALAICELPPDWFSALQQYRSHRRLRTHPTAGNAAAAYGVRGRLPIGVRHVARDLDLAFQRIHAYDPTEQMTLGVVSLVHARKRSKADTSVKFERFLVKEGFVHRTKAEQTRLMRTARSKHPDIPRSTAYDVRARLLAKHAA